MRGGRFVLGPAMALALLSLTACKSRDDRAAAAAAIAADALQSGDIRSARYQIGQAIAARDDVSDYWMLSAQIAIAAHDYLGAFNAYETALTLDRTNIEALTRLCQIAASSNQPQRAEQYAAQLAALQPGNRTATNLQAALALQHGDKATTTRLLDQLLKDDPNDETALITKSRLLSANEDYAGAAKAAEASLASPGDPIGRLDVLQTAYLKAGDATGYRRTVMRLAEASPRSAAAQLTLARSRYDAGDAAGGFAASRAALALKPGDVANADAVLHLWLAHGTAAMPAAAIVPSAAGAVPETRAAFAAYANAIGKPALALAVLGNTGAADPPATAINNAKIARAQAQALLGQRAAAAATVDAVLGADPDQPRALALRGSLRAPTDRRGAIEDLRHALSADPANADARLALANLQVADNDAVLAVQTLQDGLSDPGADPRLATRLAQLLRAQGRASDAAGAITDYVRLNPFVPRPAG